ncbi:MAG: hypothetical protein R3B06_00615 [Kofleriaceae bacterium]
MTSRSWLALAVVPLWACASGQGGAVDADAVDGPVADTSAPDSPSADAPDLDAPAPDAAVVDAAMTDAAVVDAAMTDAAVVDAAMVDATMTDASPTGPVDTCAQARDITAAAMAAGGVTLTGDLTGYANDIQPVSSCTGFTNDGPDAVYVLNLTAGRVISASVNATWDSAIEIVQPCQFTPTCLVGRDSGNPESVTYTTTAAGAFYVIVDSWDPGSFGPYTLTVTVQ